MAIFQLGQCRLQKASRSGGAVIWSCCMQSVAARIRSVLDLLQQQFGIRTPQAITLDVWEAWGRNTSLMQTLTIPLRKYAAAVNHHLADYRERLNREDLMRVGHLLLPAMPKQFRYRFVPEAEQRAVAQRKRKVKTDVISECATAILALMLARYPSMDRFIRWYSQQIERIESGELIIPVRLVYEDNQLDLPRKPGPDAVSVEELRWRTSSVPVGADHLAAVRVQPAAVCRGDPGRCAWNQRARAGVKCAVQVEEACKGRYSRGPARLLRLK
jgi:hypothetical protein